MKPVKTPDVLLKRSLPRNRHRQEECIQPSVIEALAYVAAGRQNDSWLALRHGRDCLCNRSSLFLAHATLQRKHVVQFASKLRFEVFQVLSSAGKKQG